MSRAPGGQATCVFARLDTDLGGLGKNGDCGGRGVHAAVGLRDRHTLDAVRATFVLEATEHALPRDRRRCILHAHTMPRNASGRTSAPEQSAPKRGDAHVRESLAPCPPGSRS